MTRAQVLGEALKQVKRDRAAFATLVREGDRLAAAGNVLAGTANVERLSADEQALEVLTRVATRHGPVSDALSAAARAFKSGAVGRGEAARSFLRDVRGADLAQLERGAGDGGGVAGDAGAADRPAATGEPAGEEGTEGLVAPDPRQQTLFQPASRQPAPVRALRPSRHRLRRGRPGLRLGLYFAQRRGVAESYREGLAGGQITLGGRPIQELYAGANRDVRRVLAQAWKEEAAAGGESFEIARRVAERLTERVRRREGLAASEDYRRSLYEAADIAWDIAESWPTVEINEGQLYRVEVPEDDVLLDWERPWSEQPEAVRTALADFAPDRSAGTWAERAEVSWSAGVWDYSVGGEVVGMVRAEQAADGGLDYRIVRPGRGRDRGRWFETHTFGSLEQAQEAIEAFARVDADMTGEDVYARLTDRTGSPEAASRWLNERGVKGLRYLDQVSRGDGEGSYNFVVFDDQAIDVIETYYQRQPAAHPRVGQGEARYVERADGRYVALEGGSDTLGEITPEIAGVIGREPAPIRLPAGDARFGEAHIEARHGADIRKAGYESAADLVADVAANFTRVVVEGHSGRVFLVKPNGRDRALVVELRPAEGGAEYSVVSAGLFRKSYLEGRRVLWEGERRSPIAAGEGGPLQRGGQSSGEELTQPPAPGNAPSGAALPHEPAPGALPQDVHAAVEIGADFRRIILGARSDKTSFMHESSHVFLWLLRELGTDADAAPRIRQDWETIRDFLGAADPRDEPGGGSLR